MSKTGDMSKEGLRHGSYDQCAGGCGLAPAPGDIMCTGCREGHERDRPLHPDQEFAPEPAEPIDY